MSILPLISSSFSASAFSVGRAMPAREATPAGSTSSSSASSSTASSKEQKPRSVITDVLDLSVSASLAKREASDDAVAVPAVGRVTEKSQAETTDSEAVNSNIADSESAESNTTMKSGEAKGASLSSSSKSLTPDEEAQVAKLAARDAEVRTHEQAHLAVAGQYAKGGASFGYQTGPDGRRYAVSGEVAIDASPVKGDPDATISKAQQIRAAALAPASPSSQDYKVAAAASEMEAKARIEKPAAAEAETSAVRVQGLASAPESADSDETVDETATADATKSSNDSLVAASYNSPTKSLIEPSKSTSSAASDVATAYLKQSTLSSRFSIFA